MSSPSNERIEITPDGRATYERRLVAPAHAGGDDCAKTIESCTADAVALLRDGPQFTRLPERCVFHERAGEVDAFVIEHPPTTRTIRWDTKYYGYNYGFNMLGAALERTAQQKTHELLGIARDELRQRLECNPRVQEFHVAFPYLVFCYRFVRGRIHRQYCYFRTESLTSHRDELLIADMPNVSPGHMVCLAFGKSERGSHFDLTVEDGTSMADQVLLAELQLWGSTFLNGWNAYHPGQHPALVATMWEWAASTVKNPIFPLGVAWKPAGVTVGEAVERILYATGGQDQGYDNPAAGAVIRPSPFHVLRERLRASTHDAAAPAEPPTSA